MKYSIYLFAILFLTISLSVHAQQRFSVAGRIIENNLEGAPIPFAHVYLNGTSIGAQADVNGRFILKISQKAFINFLFRWSGLRRR